MGFDLKCLPIGSKSSCFVRKSTIAGWAISLAGTALWLYGYYATGHSSFIDWPVYTSRWIADLLPNSEAEIGMALICVGTTLTYWPSTS